MWCLWFFTDQSSENMVSACFKSLASYCNHLHFRFLCPMAALQILPTVAPQFKWAYAPSCHGMFWVGVDENDLLASLVHQALVFLPFYLNILFFSDIGFWGSAGCTSGLRIRSSPFYKLDCFVYTCLFVYVH